MKHSELHKSSYEVWLRGPVEGIPALLQPAAHALLQSSEEIKKYLRSFPEHLLNRKPYGRASVGFHLRHITGVLDRMITYAKDQDLSNAQFKYLENEGNSDTHKSSKQLIIAFEQKVEDALKFFITLKTTELTEVRTVGRKKLPSTIIGLLFHSAEHSQRHVGQLMVTISILNHDDIFVE